MLSFAEAVRAGTAFIMSSYNRINGTQASADALSQNYVLMGEEAEHSRPRPRA